MSNTWIDLGNICGPQGAQGSVGPPGPPGLPSLATLSDVLTNAVSMTDATQTTVLTVTGIIPGHIYLVSWALSWYVNTTAGNPSQLQAWIENSDNPSDTASQFAGASTFTSNAGNNAWCHMSASGWFSPQAVTLNLVAQINSLNGADGATIMTRTNSGKQNASGLWLVDITPAPPPPPPPPAQPSTSSS